MTEYQTTQDDTAPPLVNELFKIVLEYCYVYMFIPCAYAVGVGDDPPVNRYYLKYRLADMRTYLETVSNALPNQDVSKNIDLIFNELNNKAYHERDIDDYLKAVFIRTSNLDQATLQLYNVIAFAYSQKFKVKSDYNVFVIAPFDKGLIQLTEASLIGSTILSREDFDVDESSWNLLPCYFRLFVLYMTIFNNIEKRYLSKKSPESTQSHFMLKSPELVETYFMLKNTVLFSGNSLFLSTTQTSHNRFYCFPELLQPGVIYNVDNPRMVGSVPPIDIIMDKYPYVTNVMQIIRELYPSTTTTISAEKKTSINIEEDSSSDDDVTTPPESSDTGDDSNSTDDMSSDDDQDDSFLTIDDNNSKTKLKDLYYRMAVVKLNKDFRNMENPPISSSDLTIFNDWCDFNLWWVSIDDTKRLMTSLKLSSYLKLFN